MVEIIRHKDCRDIHYDENVHQQEQEVLAIPKAYTVVDPGAVMIHVEYASVARRAMMASLRLEHIAHKTVTTSFVLVVAKMEAPEYGHLPRISRHCLKERPQEHHKYYVIHY